MKMLLNGLLMAGMLASGCAQKKAAMPRGAFSALPDEGATVVETPTPAKPPVSVTPEITLTGKVVSVNAAARFVVLSFPLGRLPVADQLLSAYRKGAKVGGIKVTNQRLNDYVVADLLEGDAEIGDEVRNR
jgi:hypothetical protein